MPEDSKHAFRWSVDLPNRFASDAAIALVLGISYALLLLGTRPLNPTDVSWLKTDPATHYISWAHFRQTNGWVWPLTLIPTIAYPIGEYLAFFDAVPLVAILLRPFASFLPPDFQYLGLYGCLSLILQAFFAVRLFRSLNGPAVWAVVLPTLFVLTSPAMMYRFQGHYSLASHWLILAALGLYFGCQRSDPESNKRRLLIRGSCLAAISVTINFYLAAMVCAILIATLVGLVVKREFESRWALFASGALVSSILLPAYAIGLLGWRQSTDLVATGYRSYSLNLLAPLDPLGFPALLIRQMPQYVREQYEGYNYIGLGMLLLAAFVFSQMLTRRRRILPTGVLIWPLLICTGLLTLAAASTLVTFGRHVVVDLDPMNRFAGVLGIFRGSGRLFWPAYYTMFAVIGAAVFRIFPYKIASTISGLALIVQIADTSSLREYVHFVSSQTNPETTVSSVWDSVGGKIKHLVVVPAWQCVDTPMSYLETPGGTTGFLKYGFISIREHLTINSYYSGRYDSATVDVTCDGALFETLSRPLRSDTAYVLSPKIASLLPSGPKCYSIDDSIACMAEQKLQAPLAQLPEVSLIPSEKLGPAGLEKLLYYGWYPLDPGFGAWSGKRALIALRIKRDSRWKSIRLGLRAVLGRDPIRFRVFHASGTYEGQVRGTYPAGMREFELILPLAPNQSEVQWFQFLTANPKKPVDLGINGDPRALGIGIHSVEVSEVSP